MLLVLLYFKQYPYFTHKVSFYTLQSASFHYILRNTPETCYRALKTTPKTKRFLSENTNHC